MKDHIQESKLVSFYEIEGDPALVSEKLTSLIPENAIDPTIEVETSWDYQELKLNWWRPMTERELEKAANRRKTERDKKKKAAAMQEDEERKEYERLKKKFEDN